MITSAENYTKKKPKMDRQNHRTNGTSKAIQTKSHTSIHIHTHKKLKGENIYISLLPKSPS